MAASADYLNTLKLSQVLETRCVELFMLKMMIFIEILLIQTHGLFPEKQKLILKH